MTLCLFALQSLPRSYGSGLKWQSSYQWRELAGGHCTRGQVLIGPPGLEGQNFSLREDRNKNNTICTSLWSFNYHNE